MRIHIARTPSEIDACFPIMSTLRPQLAQHQFAELVQRLMASTGFQLAYLEDAGIQCVAGFRISEWLAGGRYLEIEDLVAQPDARSRGYGGHLFDWLVDVAKANACDHVRLVSRLQRADAHRFYERKGMVKEAYYFSLRLES